MEKIGIQPIALEDKNISQANVLKVIYENSYHFSFVWSFCVEKCVHSATNPPQPTAMIKSVPKHSFLKKGNEITVIVATFP